MNCKSHQRRSFWHACRTVSLGLGISAALLASPSAAHAGIPFLFTTGDSFSLGNIQPWDVGVGDFNRDLRPDLVVAAEGEPHGFLLIQGQAGPPNFAPPTLIVIDPRATESNGGKSILVIDINDDGFQDVILAREQSAITVSPGNGDGTFGAPITVMETRGVNQGTLWPLRMTTFELDGDGDQDLLVLDGRNGDLSVLRNDGGFSFALVQTIPLVTAVTQIDAGDLNNDGLDDVAWTAHYGIKVALNSGAGTLGEPVFIDIAGAKSNQLFFDVTIIDLDLDGDEDVFATLPEVPNSFLCVGLNDGTGTITPSGLIPIPINSPVDVACADFDGDQRIDIAVLEGTGLVFFLRNETVVPGEFVFNNVFSVPTGIITLRVIPANFDGDCDHDLVAVSRYSGSIITLRNISFQHSQCTVADFDFDGDVDGSDLAFLLSEWGKPVSPADLDYSGRVGGWDLAILLWAWQQPSPTP